MNNTTATVATDVTSTVEAIASQKAVDAVYQLSALHDRVFNSYIEPEAGVKEAIKIVSSFLLEPINSGEAQRIVLYAQELKLTAHYARVPRGHRPPASPSELNNTLNTVCCLLTSTCSAERGGYFAHEWVREAYRLFGSDLLKSQI